MLRQRLVAAALGLPMLFLLLWLNWFFRSKGSPDDLPLLLIVTLIAGASGWEFSGILRQRFPHASHWNGLYAALIIPFITHAVRVSPSGNALVPVSSLGLLIDSLGATAAVMLLFLGIWSDVERHGRGALRENALILLAGLYIGGTTSFLLVLGVMSRVVTGAASAVMPLHEAPVLLVFMAVFALDTAAYFGGKRFAGPRLAPAISPQKTVSGAACGLVAAIVLAVAFMLVPGAPGHAAWWSFAAAQLSWWQFALLGATIGVMGQLGDLLESAVKRWGGVKDSGSVIPGHGGFLDRFDSLFLAAPIYYFLLQTFFMMPR